MAKSVKKKAAKASQKSRSVPGAAKSNAGNRVFEPALCLVGPGDLVVFGMTTQERLKRQFSKAGISTVLTADEASDRNGPVVFVRADAVLDQPLVPIIAKRPNLMLVDKAGDEATPLAISINGLQGKDAIRILEGKGPNPDALKLLVRSPEGLEAAFWKGLRKRETPYAQLVNRQNHGEAEWRMYMGTYKGATDFITKYLWPRPAFFITRRLAGTPVTPNMVTTIGAVCVVVAMWLFWNGHFIAGLIAAWLMTFLDTVDGKLARTTLTSSKWGDIFDHGIDLIHPPFWYAAWGYGVLQTLPQWPPQTVWWTCFVIVAGYILQRLMEGAAIKWLGLEIHIWRPIDTFFRQITARRNPNLAILSVFAILGLPGWGLVIVAVWTVICLALHGVQLWQAFAEKSREGPLQSWMSAQQPGRK